MSDKPVNPEAAPTQPPAESTPRPRRVTLLALGVLSIAVLGLLRFYLAIRQWPFLESWPGVSPAYLAFSGLGVGLLALWVFAALWFRKAGALRLAQAGVLTLALAYWLDQIFIADRPFADPAGVGRAFLPSNWLFTAGVTAIILMYTAWVTGRADVRAYFGETNE